MPVIRPEPKARVQRGRGAKRRRSANEWGSVKKFIYNIICSIIMPSFLARKKKTKTKRPVSFKTGSGKTVSFKAKRKPKRRTRVSF